METKNPPANSAPPASVSFFSTPAALSAHQADRELEEAIRVHTMSPVQFSQWFGAEWGRVQSLADAAMCDALPTPATARSFATLAEKNRHDEDSELAAALALAGRRKRRT